MTIWNPRAGLTLASLAANIQEAMDFLENEENSLKSQSLSNEDLGCKSGESWICQAHGKVKAITDQLKGDFVKILDLKLPDSSAGDND